MSARMASGLGLRAVALDGRPIGGDQELREVPLDRRAEPAARVLLQEREHGVRRLAVDVHLRRQRELDAEVDPAELLDLRVVARLLVRELVAREADHDEAWSAYASWSACSPSYWGVKPHWLAVLTTRRGRPA